MSKEKKKTRSKIKKGRMSELEVTQKAKNIKEDLKTIESEGELVKIHRKLIEQEGVGRSTANRIIEKGIDMIEKEDKLKKKER